ncbi:Hypothetical protein CINCED_3A003781, partial [Cinara cedri]
SAKFSEELQNIIEVCEEKIINKVVKFCIENNDISPEAVVREVMEEIKFNKEQIIREDEISEELVNRGISTLLDEINVSQAKASGIEVVEFLSSHRRFRILWLEFGATLFEYLCKQKGYKPKELIERGKKGESIEKECAELLMELGEMRAKWWWPCSFKIKDIEISEEEAKRVKEYNDYNLFPSLFYGLYTSVILHQFC